MQIPANFGTRVRASQHKSLNNGNGGDVMGCLRGMAAFGAVVSMMVLALPVSGQAAGQAAGQELAPSGASAAAHSVVRWSGVMPGYAGKVVELQLGIFENQAGGQALWSETQRVVVGVVGHYSVLVGATSGTGLPEGLFPTGEARWIEARLAGNDGAVARSLMTAVPYAFKAADSDTLGGLPATEYVTREQMQAASGAGAVLPGGAGLTGAGPQLAGTGTTNALAVWTNSTTLGSSVVTESSAKIGIGTTTPATTLDVKGPSTLRGVVDLPALTGATATAGTNSPAVEWGASSYSSSTKAAIAQNFELEAAPVGNNTTAPSGKLELLFGAGGASPAATGLSFAANGQITFAAGQKFPGTGTITGITTTSPLTGSGTSGSVALGLNTAALETTLNGKFAQLAAGNYFTSTSTSTFNGPIVGNSNNTMFAIQGNSSSGSAIQGYATGTNGWGVNGYATGIDGIGVYGNAVANADTNGNYPIGVKGHTLQGNAVMGVSDEETASLAAVFGQNSGPSGIYNFYKSLGNITAGVWGDVGSGQSPLVSAAVFGTTDDGYGGAFNNNSATWPAIYGYNQGSGGTGLFRVAMLRSQNGTCGVGGSGSLSCTGQIKTLVSAGGGTKTVETYSVQSPENWMEDFGSGSLSGGGAVVTIDAAFAETVSADASYKVFLTPNGESKGLYVTNKTATSFEVRESGGGTASIGFDYRVVAKRRGFEAQRMVDVTETFHREMSAGQKTGIQGLRDQGTK